MNIITRMIEEFESNWENGIMRGVVVIQCI